LFGTMFTFGGTQSGPSPRASAQDKPLLATRPSALLDCSFFSPLDSLIQDRFTQMGRGFGIVRVATPGRTLHGELSNVSRISESKRIAMFVPENAQEREVVAEIEQSGLMMVLYLASRNILGTEPDDKDRYLTLHAHLRGPVALTKSSPKTDWPEISSLWRQARKAMQDFDSDKSAFQYEFSAEGKDFIARPVRAQESCLKCHTTETYLSITPSSDGLTRRLGVGDPIGVLLYAYAKSEESNNIKKP
jgi:hypothetical protein